MIPAHKIDLQFRFESSTIAVHQKNLKNSLKNPQFQFWNSTISVLNGDINILLKSP